MMLFPFWRRLGRTTRCVADCLADDRQQPGVQCSDGPALRPAAAYSQGGKAGTLGHGAIYDRPHGSVWLVGCPACWRQGTPHPLPHWNFKTLLWLGSEPLQVGIIKSSA